MTVRKMVKFYTLILLMLYIHLTRGYHLGDVQGNGSCTNVFHVWSPNQDFMSTIEGLHARISNSSQHFENKYLTLHNELLQLTIRNQNISANVDRQLLVCNLEDEKFNNEINKIWAHLNQVQNHASMISDGTPQSGHGRRHDNSDRALAQLRSLVNNLKAEWIVIKRDVRSTKDKVAQLEALVENMDVDTRTLKASIDELKNSATSLQDRVDLPNIVYPQDAQIVDDITELRAKINSLTQRVAKLEFTRSSESVPRSTTPHSVVTISLDTDYNHGNEHSHHPTDCHDVYTRGMHTSAVYQIKPASAGRLDNVYCEMLNGTGWTVVQRRQDGSAQFNQAWREYKHGFGSLYGEFWLGNEMLHMLTNQKKYKLRVDMWDWDGQRFVAEYSHVHVASEDNNYQLTVSGFSGDAGDSLGGHNGYSFSTADRDNDLHTNNCAEDNKAGWWFSSCYDSNLNGLFTSGGISRHPDGIVWNTLRDTSLYSLKRTEMKISPQTV